MSDIARFLGVSERSANGYRIRGAQEEAEMPLRNTSESALAEEFAEPNRRLEGLRTRAPPPNRPLESGPEPQ